MIRPRPFAALFAALLLVSCHATEPSGEIATVINKTPVDLVVLVVADGSFLDPLPFLAPGTFDDLLVRRGERHPIDHVDFYTEGGGLTIYVYIVGPTGATIATAHNFSGATIKATRGELAITTVPQPRPAS